jgi:hypothetical protein
VNRECLEAVAHTEQATGCYGSYIASSTWCDAGSRLLRHEVDPDCRARQADGRSLSPS